MTSNNLITGTQARNKIMEGIDLVADMVKATIGPNGRNAMLDQYGHVITNDGVSIAKDIKSDDPYVQMGIQFIQEVAKQANKVAGDGTSTTITLVQALAHESFKRLNWRTSVTEFRKQLNEACETVLKDLEKSKKKITKEKLRKLTRLSVESDTIGDMIADAQLTVGEYGKVLFEKAEQDEVTVEFKSGYALDGGYRTAHLTKAGKIEENNIPVLVWNKRIPTLAPLEGLLNELINKGKKTVAIVISHIDDLAVEQIITNHINSVITIIPIPILAYHGDVMEDIAIFTGAKHLKGIESPVLDDLGEITKLVQTDSETFISSDSAECDTKERIKELLAMDASGIHKKEIEKRIAKLSGKLAQIKIGAPSEQEKDYLYRKIEDAVHASEKSVKHGYVAGGGCAYVHAINSIKGKDKGSVVMREALHSPIINILRNGDERYSIKKEILKGKTYNAKTKQFDDDVIDSYLTVKTAIQVSTSAVSTLLSIEGVVINNATKN